MAESEKAKLRQIANLADAGSKNAWGGIGGSGKHAAEMIAELQEMTKNPEVRELLDNSRKAWGGIGGSGKHAAELDPEIFEGK